MESIQIDSMPSHVFGSGDLMVHYLNADSVNSERAIIDFGVDIFQTGFNPNKDLELVLNPPVEFSIYKASSSSVLLLPKSGFMPDQRYELTVKRFDYVGQSVDLTQDPSLWTHSFQTPPLTFLGAVSKMVEGRKDRFKIELAYSSSVTAPDVSVAADGLPVEGVAVASNANKHLVTVSGQLKANPPKALSLEIAKTASLLNPTVLSDKQSRRVALLANKGLTLYGPFIKETSAGFVVEFICDDRSVEGYRPWHWDNSINFDKRISKRCHLPAEEISKRVSILPEIETDLYHTAHGFALRANLVRGKYQVRLQQGLQSVDGGMLAEDIKREFVAPNRGAMLRFVSKGRYLPKSAWGKIAIRHRNVSNASVQIRHIPRENLHVWLNQEGDSVRPVHGDVVYTKSLTLTGGANETGSTVLDFSNQKEVSENGVYEVRLAGGGQEDFLRVQVTDLNLVVKKEGLNEVGHKEANPMAEQNEPKSTASPPVGGRLHVWALNMGDNKPAPFAKIQIYRPSGLLADTCQSDANGYCLFDTVKDQFGNRNDYLIAASLGNRFTYMQPDELMSPLGEYDVSGDTRSDQSYRLSIHSDRGAYRPGDTAHINAVIRNADGKLAAKGIKVGMRLTDARGRTLKEKIVQTNAAGVLSESFVLSETAGTGRWALHLELGPSQKEVYRFLVEDLAPERMAIHLTPDASDVLAGEPVSVQIEARYLFGSQASNAPFEMKCRVRYSPFQPTLSKGYVFGSNTPFDAFDLGSVRGRLDEHGRAGAVCPDMIGSKVALGPAKVEMTVSVFEAGSGRRTVKKSRVRVHESRHYLGFKSGLKAIEAGNTYSFSGVVVDWQGRRVDWNQDMRLDFSLLQTGHNWIYNEQSGQHMARRYQKELPISQQSLSIKKGRFHFGLSAEQQAGRFRVRATSDGLTATYDIPGKSRYWWESNKDVDQTPSPLKPDKLEIEAPALIEPGETPSISVVAPYAGRLLWTVETDRVLTSQWVNVPVAGKLRWEPDMSVVGNAPNAYISALLIKDPHLESQEAFFPNRALGIKSIRIKPIAHLHQTTLSAPKEIASQSTLKIDVDLGGDVEEGTVVMVSAVDEGLLTLTHFKRPDPLPKLFPREPLKVTSHETIGWATMIPAAKSVSAVGGGGGSENKLNKMNQRPDVIKPVSLYSGVVAVPKSGKTTIEFQLPQYSGQLRVVAISASPSKIGMASTDVIVADPVVVSATTPRFLTQEDVFVVPVFMSNRSGESKSISVSLTASDPKSIQVLGDSTRSISLDNGASETLPLKAKALFSNGFTTLKIKTTIDGESKILNHEVPFQSAAPRYKETVVQRLGPGESFDFTAIDAYRSGQAHLLVSQTPYVKALGHAKHLIRYPHGCLEQTTSALRPLLSATDVLPSIGLKAIDVDNMIMTGVERLSAMQTPSGGYGYWPGSTSPHKWATAYATHVLLDAKSAGHPVFSGMIESALSFMKSEIQYKRLQMDQSEPYMHYVLAKAGQGDRSRIKALIASRRKAVDSTSWEDLFLLKAALHLSGDRRYESDLKNPRATMTATTQHTARFWSPLRANAMALSIHQDLFGLDLSESHAMELAALLERDSNRYSTQELSWAFYALSRRVSKTSNASWRPPELKYDQRPLVSDFDSKRYGRSWKINDINDVSRAQMVAVDTSYATLRIIGDKADTEMLYGSSGIDVQREYLDSNGKELNVGALNLGDVAYVRLTVSNTEMRDLHELALVDRIPAGWEIENVNLGRGGDLKRFYTQKPWNVDYQSIRDNRFVVYGDLKTKTASQIVYAVRAVTAGIFQSPSVEVEAMYMPEVWSKKSGPIITIQGPWAGSQL